MSDWVCLLRGINVGGRNRLPMADLRRILASLHCERCQTVLQSGNAVFSSRERSQRRLAESIAVAIEQDFGFRPDVMLLSAAALQAAADDNPFAESFKSGSQMHYFFLERAVRRPDRERLASLAATDERFALHGKVFYLLAPSGIGRSRLAAQAERCLGVPTTARNHRTLERLLSLLSDRDA